MRLLVICVDIIRFFKKFFVLSLIFHEIITSIFQLLILRDLNSCSGFQMTKNRLPCNSREFAKINRRGRFWFKYMYIPSKERRTCENRCGMRFRGVMTMSRQFVRTSVMEYFYRNNFFCFSRFAGCGRVKNHF